MVTDIPWQQMRRDYEKGATYRQLAERYGVSSSTIGRRCRLENWTRGGDRRLERCVEQVSLRLLEAVEELLGGEEALNTRELKDLTALTRDLEALRQTVRQQQSDHGGEGVRVVLEGPLEEWGS